MQVDRGVLSDLPLLRFLSSELRDVVAASFAAQEHAFGEVIVAEGDPADAYYVLASGRARVLTRGEGGGEVPLGTLRAGEGFGETGLLEGKTRTATIRASTACTVLRLDGSVFRALVDRHAEIGEAFALVRRERQLMSFFRRYSAFARLPPETLERLLREFDDMSVASGTTVVAEGDPGDAMYVVETGRLCALHTANGAREVAGYIRRGDIFGEIALFRGTPREASVEAVTDARLLRLPAATFRRLLDAHPELRTEMDERISLYERGQIGEAPLDFAGEILPADPGVREVVGLDQVDVAEGELEEPAAETFDVETEAPQRRIRRFPHVWQIDEMDCGAACLAMVTRHFGKRVSLGHIREMVATTVDGTSLLGITEGGKALGLETRSVKASKNRLDRLPLPAIAHWEGHHWLVVYALDRRRVHVADPARGLRRIPRDEFLEKWSGYAALVAPTPALERTPLGRFGVEWAWRLLRPHRGALVSAGLLALAATAAALAIPVVGQRMIDAAVSVDPGRRIDVLFVGMLGVLAASVAATALQRFLLARRAVRMDTEAVRFLGTRLLSLPMRYFQTRRDADIARRLDGVREAREFLVRQGAAAVGGTSQILLATGLMFAYDWRMALVFFALLPAYAVLATVAIRRIRPLYGSLEEAWAKHQAKQLDAVKGIETVKATASEDRFRELIEERFRALADRVVRADLAVMAYDAVVQVITLLALALFLWVGARQVAAGRLSIGELVSFNALLVLAVTPVSSLLSVVNLAQYAGVLLTRVNDVLEQEPEQGEESARLTAVTTLEGRVTLEGVGFRYPGPLQQMVLDGINLDVAPGTLVAFVGRSGSGKTTVARLLAGLIRPTTGRITYDGIDLRELDVRTLRRKVGFVLQEGYLFDETIAANIAIGDDAPDMDRVTWAAKVANAAGFVERLPLGYDTRVGETGILLSGGQKQRIAIARAVYRRPPVLIFDEATSSLDGESEREVQEAIDRLLAGRTTFVIAHRLSTIRNADLIVVLEQGQIAERGTHDELIARQSLYHYLLSRQLGME